MLLCPNCPQTSFNPLCKADIRRLRAYCPNIYTVSKGHNEATSGDRSDTASILSMPKPRLRFLQLVRTQLLRQSEDCLYLNVFVPKAALVAASAASKASDGRPRKRKQQQKRGKDRIHHSSIFRVPCVYVSVRLYNTFVCRNM